MELNNICSLFFSFILAFIITWIVLSVVLIWINPNFYNDDGSLNWVTTLWVAIVIVLLVYVFLFLLYLIWWLIKTYAFACDKACDSPCVEKVACMEKVEACNPCDMKYPKFGSKKMYL